MSQPSILPRRTGLFRTAIAIAWKDLRAELRSRETVLGMAVFALLSVLLFSFSLELDKGGREASASGVLWVTLIFAGTLGLGRSLSRERDQNNLDGLMLLPTDRSAIFFGKLISNFVTMGAVAVLLLPFVSILLDTSFFRPLFAVILILGILGYAGVGTLIASISVYSRGREVLLPVLLLPIALSILIPAVRATRGLLQGIPFDEMVVWFNLLFATNGIYLTLAYMLFEYVVEE